MADQSLSSVWRRVGARLLTYTPIAAVLLAFLSLLAMDPAALNGLEPQWPGIGISLLLLCIVFAARALIWRQLTGVFGYPTSVLVAMIASNRSLPLKYIPGKFWVVLGRAGYVHRATAYPLLPLSALSLFLQFLTVMVGLLLGMVGLTWLYFPIMVPGELAACLGLFLFFGASRRVPAAVLRPMPAGGLRNFLAAASLPPLTGIITAVVAQWLLLGCAYVLFFMSCSVDVPLIALLLQPAANAAGIAAVFAPGGIGIREGVATAYLVQIGVTLPLALALGIAARLWFFAAEILMFVLSYLAGTLRSTISIAPGDSAD